MPRPLRIILIIPCGVVLLVAYLIFRPRTKSVKVQPPEVGSPGGYDEASARKLRALVSELSDPKSSDKAVPEIQRLVASEPRLRGDLANGLKTVIYNGLSTSRPWKNPPPGTKLDTAALESMARPWKNAMRVAGDLKIVELAPDIANFVDRPGSQFVGVSSASEEEPAGTALAKMCDAAIPALMHVAEIGSRSQRSLAPIYISWIGTPKAHQALENLLGETKDPDFKKEIESLLRAFGQAPLELTGSPPSNPCATQGSRAEKPPQGNGTVR